MFASAQKIATARAMMHHGKQPLVFDIVLSLDLSGLPDAEIETIVAERCSDLGSVEAVRVYRPLLPDGFPFALVNMSSPVEVERVAKSIGDFIFGRAALVKLAQEPATASPESAADCAAPSEPRS